MKERLNDKTHHDRQKNEQLDMFEILEDIIPLCDAGKALVKGETPVARPIIDNDIRRISAGLHKKPR